ncbi:MAG: hypothetical protein ABIX28_23840, partial [Vicinamibacterales bacterium]
MRWQPCWSPRFPRRIGRSAAIIATISNPLLTTSSTAYPQLRALAILVQRIQPLEQQEQARDPCWSFCVSAARWRRGAFSGRRRRAGSFPEPGRSTEP